MAKQREELTRKAVEQGVETTPGQLEAVGLLDQDDAEDAPEPAGPLTAAECGKYWRCRILNATVQDAGAPDHVVRARDKANARETFFREFGVISVDETVNKVEIAPATEHAFVAAQAKRFNVDLREHRKVDVPKKHADYGRLTWQPPGGRKGEYRIGDKGELTAAE